MQISDAAVFGLDLQSVNGTRDQLNGQHCCIQALTNYDLSQKKMDQWVWPGHYDWVGLDSALKSFMQCLFEKSQQVKNLLQIRFCNVDSRV